MGDSTDDRGKPFRVRVVCDGLSVSRCNIYNAETGEKINNVMRFSLDVDANIREPAIVALELMGGFEVESLGVARTMMRTLTGETVEVVRRDDGSYEEVDDAAYETFTDIGTGETTKVKVGG